MTGTPPEANPLPPPRTTYRNGESAEIVRQQVDEGRNIGALLVTGALERRGWSARWIDGRTSVLEKDGKQILHQGHRGGETPVGKALVADKWLTKQLLQAGGVATPRGRLARSAQEAIQLRDELLAPIVVKPRLGMKQAGVSVNLRSDEEIRTAFQRASSVKGGVLVEEYRAGLEEYRCLSTPEECVSVVRRLLPRVVGDGSSTIRELIERKNAARTYIPSTFNRPIPIDEVTKSHLARVGFTLDDVLADGQELVVRDVGGLSTGGEPYECFDSVDERIKGLAARAAAAIPGLTWGGVDVMVSRETGEPFIIEINSDADISGASFPIYGEPARVADVIAESRVTTAVRDAPVPEVCAPAEVKQVALQEHIRDVVGDSSTGALRLSALLSGYFDRSGYDVHSLGSGVIRVDRQGEMSQWFHRSLGMNDLAVVESVLSRHGTTRRLLSSQGAPLMPWRVVKYWKSCSSFWQESGLGAIQVVPFFQPWNRSSGRVFDSAADVDRGMFTGRTTWVAQATNTENRFGVWANRERAGLITSQRRVSNATSWMIEAAASAAVQAVRAVPGLRWAWVDIALTSSPYTEGAVAAVEGMTLNPRLDPTLVCVGGTLADVLREISSLATGQD